MWRHECYVSTNFVADFLVRRGGEAQSGRGHRAKGGTGEVRTHFVLSPVGLKRRKCKGRRIRE